MMCSAALLLSLTAGFAEEPATIQGTVVDEAGRPVAGASLVLSKSYRPDRVERAKSAADGRFAVPDLRGADGTWVLLAHKSGSGIGGVRLGATDDDDSLTLTLRTPRPIAVEIHSPDDEPLSDVALSLGSLTVGELSIHAREVFKEFSWRTDQGGGATIDVPPDANFSVLIEADRYGTQLVYAKPGMDRLTIALRRVGRLEGRITADGPEAVRGVRLQVHSSPADAEPPAVYGLAEVESDASGRFVVPALAEGDITVTTMIAPGSKYRAVDTIRAKLEAGQTAEVEIALQKGIRVHGTVVDRESGEPVPGARVYVGGGGGTLTTDEGGAYETFVAPGRVFVNLSSLPPPYITPANSHRQITVETGKEPQELEPYAVRAGVRLDGVVVDEHDRPIAGATIVAAWQKEDGGFFTLGESTARSKPDGRFILEAVSQTDLVGIRASTGERGSVEMLKIAAGETPDRPLRLRITPEGMAVLSGRVVDEQGRAVAGAQITVRAARQIPSGRPYGQQLVSFKGSEPLVTDQDGGFRTPESVSRLTSYSVRAEAAGLLAKATDYISIPDGVDELSIPDIVLQRVQQISGQVVDGQGAPISGASVRAPGAVTEGRADDAVAKTDTDGRFDLQGIHPRARLFFVETPGYRITGGTIPDGDRPLEVTLTRTDEAPPARPPRTIEFPPDEQRKLLRELLLPVFEVAREKNAEWVRAQVLKVLAPHDREFVLEHWDAVTRPSYQVEVLTALDRLEDALERAEGIENAYSRTHAYFGIIDAVEDRRRKEELLATALIHARAVQNPARRVVLLGSIAERLYDLGQRAAAEPIVSEGKRLAAELATADWDGFARGHFAETLALFDLDAALELIEALQDANAWDRHHGNIAHEIAALQPAEAERMLSRLKNDYRRDEYAVRVCYWMVAVDPARARTIAVNVQRPERKAWALGVMAEALHGSEPESARETLHSAFDVLAAAARNPGARRNAFPTAANLVSISETVDPDRTLEYFWQALAMHPGPESSLSSPDDQQERADQQIATLALLMALYGLEPHACEEMMQPVFSRGKHYVGRPGYNTTAIYCAMTLVDPARMIELSHQFVTEADEQALRIISPPQPWRMAADLLGASSREQLWRQLQNEVFHVWSVDKEG